MIIEEPLKILNDLYFTNSHRVFKWQVLMDCASKVTSGTIVELGTYHGAGAAALSMGMTQGIGVKVITIDDYQTKVGWAGEVYTPDDFLMFLRMSRKFREVTGLTLNLICDTFDDAAYWWDQPIGLLFWDAGANNILHNDIKTWSQFVIPNGMVLIHDTFNFHFKSDKIGDVLDIDFSPVKIADNPQGMSLFVRDFPYIEDDKEQTIQEKFEDVKAYLRQTPRGGT